jgi:hypothetical protein
MSSNGHAIETYDIDRHTPRDAEIIDFDEMDADVLPRH